MKKNSSEKRGHAIPKKSRRNQNLKILPRTRFQQGLETRKSMWMLGRVLHCALNLKKRGEANLDEGENVTK